MTVEELMDSWDRIWTLAERKLISPRVEQEMSYELVSSFLAQRQTA